MSRHPRKPAAPGPVAGSEAGSVSTSTEDRSPVSALDFVRHLLHIQPDPTQAQLLEQDPHRCILNCTRQWGKSTITAAKAVHKACTQPGSLTVALSPSARQSGEFVRKAKAFLLQLGYPPKGDGHNEISLVLPNDSRIVGLPSSEEKIRGFSAVSLLLIDEAARVEDSLYQSVRPMLAASDGQLWLMSTPSGRLGFFYKEWISSSSQWTRFAIPASQCPRISARFLDEEQKTLPAHMFRQEYCCEFLDAEDAVFPSTLLEESLTDFPPLHLDRNDLRTTFILPAIDAHIQNEFAAQCRASGAPPLPADPHYYIGVDLGQSRDYTAICVIETADILAGPRCPVTYAWPKKKIVTVRHLERLPLGTPFTEISSAIAALTRSPALGRYKQLIVDGTGLGAPVVEMIRKDRPDALVHTVILTSGNAYNRTGDTHHLPRAELLTRLEIAFQSHRLTISKHLPYAQTLLQELQSLRRKPRDSGAETILPESGADHDDLVFATALAYWRTTW